MPKKKGLALTKDGVTKFFKQSEIHQKVKEGWETDQVIETAGGGKFTTEELRTRDEFNTGGVVNDQAANTDARRAEEDEERFSQAKYKGLAAVAGVGDGLTLGGVSAAAGALGVGDKLSKAQEYNPVTSGISEVAGTVAGAVASGGTSLLAKAPAAVATRLATKAGAKVAGRAGKVAGLATEGAVEGALFTGGAAIGQAALSDSPIDAEKIIASMGSGALMGGVAGSAIGGLGKLSNRIKLSQAAKAQAKATKTGGREVGEHSMKAFNTVKDDIVASSKRFTGKLEKGKLSNVEQQLGMKGKHWDDFTDERGMEWTAMIAQKTGAKGRPTAAAFKTLVKAERKEIARIAKDVSKVNINKLDDVGIKKYVDDIEEMKRLQHSLSENLGEPLTEINTAAKLDLEALRKESSSIDTPLVSDAGELTPLAKELQEKGIDVGKLSEESQIAVKLWSENATRRSAGEAADQIAKAGNKAKPEGNGMLGSVLESAKRYTLASIHPMLAAVPGGTKRIQAGVASFIKHAGKPRKGSVPAAASILGRVSFNADLGEKPKNNKKHSGRVKDFKRVAAELESLTKNPDTIRTKAYAKFGHLYSSKPGLADQLLASAVKRIEYLGSLVPKSPLQTGFGPDNWQPSQTEVDKFARIVAAAEDPYSILDDMGSGKLTQEAVDTVKALYPQLYDEMRMEIVTNADDIKKKVGYQGRLQLGILFQAPTDKVLQPAFVQQMQQNFAMRDQEREQQGQGQFSTPGSAQSAIAGQQTASQKVEGK